MDFSKCSQLAIYVALYRFMNRSTAGHLTHLPVDQLPLRFPIVRQRVELNGSHAYSDSGAHGQILAQLLQAARRHW